MCVDDAQAQARELVLVVLSRFGVVGVIGRFGYLQSSLNRYDVVMNINSL